MRCGLFAAALVLAAAQPGLAQTAADQSPQDPAQHFQAYVTSDGYKKLMAQLAMVGESVSAPECKAAKPVERASLTVYVPPLFETGVHPVSGLWVDRIKIDRCGATNFQNILVQAQPGDKAPRAALLMPGTTLTNPPMQSLIMKDVLEGLAKKKCTDQAQIVPAGTSRDKEVKPVKLNEKGMIVEGAWKETWSFRACGKVVKATIDISADGKGSLTHKVKM